MFRWRNKSNRQNSKSDVCVNGMFLNYASYFGANETDLKSIIDFLLSLQMKDGDLIAIQTE